MGHTKKGYKLVIEEGERVFSCGHGHYPELGDSYRPWDREYRVGKWERPEKGWGPITVLATLKDAKLLQKAPGYIFTGAPIYRCEYRESRKKFLRFTDRDWTLQIELDELPWPCKHTTVFASSIRLLERVDS